MNRTKIYLLAFFVIILFFLESGCKQDKIGVYQQSTYTETGGVKAVIEIPAGTNHKIEYRPSIGEFVNDTLQGKERVINFLPYPGNYGFIPSTLMDEERGGDGDALDILVIGESMETGTTIGTIPIGALILRDKGQIDTKIIAIPIDSSLQVISPKNYEDFVIQYNAAHHIIQEWFMNYKGLGVMELMSWKDEQYAFTEIKKWTKNSAK